MRITIETDGASVTTSAAGDTGGTLSGAAIANVSAGGAPLGAMAGDAASVAGHVVNAGAAPGSTGGVGPNGGGAVGTAAAVVNVGAAPDAPAQSD